MADNIVGRYAAVFREFAVAFAGRNGAMVANKLVDEVVEVFGVDTWFDIRSDKIERGGRQLCAVSLDEGRLS